MTAPLPRPATNESLFLWIMHRFAEAFDEHAVLKGGMALRLVDSPRGTTDIDYVFVPFRSKRDVPQDIERVLREIDGADVSVSLHSTMLRADVRIDDAAVQVKVEISVATACDSAAMATGGFATSLGQPSQVVRVMEWSTALAHKLAAWNERRLLLDLYDCYFLSARVGAEPEMEILQERLDNVRSRRPELKSLRRMSREELASALRDAAAAIDDRAIAAEMGPLLPETEMAGLEVRLRVAILRLADALHEE